MSHERTRLSTEAFKAIRRAGKSTGDAVLVKRAASTIRKAEGEDVDPDARLLTATISTSAVDRHGDTIQQSGWQLANFEKGGVILWNHDAYLPPIGKPVSVEIDGDVLRSTAEFATREQSELADTVYQLSLGGYIRATSVGFIPIKVEERELSDDENPELFWEPLNFVEQELLEWSPVSIPANPEALIDAKAKGINVAPVARYVKRFLDGEGGGALWLTRDIAERAYWAAREDGNPVHSVPAKSADALLSADVARAVAEREDAAMSGGKAAITYGHAHSNGTPAAEPEKAWSAAAERKKANVDDLKKMSAWVDDHNPDAKASYRLLHHHCDITYTLNWKGLQAAMSGLLSGRSKIPDADRRSCYEHLAAHYMAYKSEAPPFDCDLDPEDQGCDEDEDKALPRSLPLPGMEEVVKPAKAKAQKPEPEQQSIIDRIKSLRAAIESQTESLAEEANEHLDAAVAALAELAQAGMIPGAATKSRIKALAESVGLLSAERSSGAPDAAALAILNPSELSELGALVSAAVRQAVRQAAGRIGD